MRVGIARAVYAYSDIILLDDPFSALDHNTAAALYNYLIKLKNGLCICSRNDMYSIPVCDNPDSSPQRAIIIVTHSHEYLIDCTDVLVYEHGTVISRQVAPASNSTDVASYVKGATSNLEKSINANIIEITSQNEQDLIDRAIPFPEDIPEELSEKREKGKIASTIYWFYLQSMGYCLVIIILLSTFFMQVTANMMSIYLAYWAQQQSDNENNDAESVATHRTLMHVMFKNSNEQFLVILGSIVCLNVVFTSIRSFSFARGGLIAARRIYDKLTDGVLHTSQIFFDHTPAGRITNRFGKDTNCIDDQLPFIVNIVLAQCFSLLGSCFTIIYSCAFMILILLLVFYIYYYLQEFYRNSSRELKRLDSTSKSPIYTLLSECLANGPCIRANRFQNKQNNVHMHTSTTTLVHFEKLYTDAVDLSLKVSLNESTGCVNTYIFLEKESTQPRPSFTVSVTVYTPAF